MSSAQGGGVAGGDQAYAPQKCRTVMPTATSVSIAPGPNFGKVLSVDTPATIATAATAANPAPAAAAQSTLPPPDPAVVAAKKSMRASIGRTLAAMSAEEVADASAALTARLISNPAYVRSAALCLYVSMPSGELQTMELLRHAFAAGKKVFVPRIEMLPKKVATAVTPAGASAPSVTVGAPAAPAPTSRMRMLQLHSLEELDSIPPNRWGIREPAPTLSDGVTPRLDAVDCAELDLVVCPGVAFDAQRRRLGHGKGYYDSWLAALRHHRSARSLPPARTIAIGFDQQMVEAVSVGPLDLALDEVLTPSHHHSREGGSGAPPAAAAKAPASPSGGAMTPFASPEPGSSAGTSASAAAAPLPVAIRIGQASDAALLSSFARSAFSAAFAAHNTASDMSAYLDSAFSPAIQESELRDPAVTYFLAFAEGDRDSRLLGYAMMRDEPAPDCVSDRRAPEIQRIYGVGVGAALMRRCLSHAAWLGRSTTWLGVWEKNVRASRFYQRYGYKDVGSHDFLLGEDRQTDRIMERRIDPLESQELPTSSGAVAVDTSDLYAPLPTADDTRARVLDSFKNAPRTELEREHGCSTLQVACILRMPLEQVETHAAALAAEGRLATTRDAQHYR